MKRAMILACAVLMTFTVGGCKPKPYAGPINVVGGASLKTTTSGDSAVLRGESIYLLAVGDGLPADVYLGRTDVDGKFAVSVETKENVFSIGVKGDDKAGRAIVVVPKAYDGSPIKADLSVMRF